MADPTGSSPADRVAGGYAQLEERAAAWASNEPAVRAVIVLGSRARTDHPADEWADLDIVLIVSDDEPLIGDRNWVAQIGEPWIDFVERTAGGEARELRVLFAGGFDVDFALLTVPAVEHMLEHDPNAGITAFGRGHRVLLDKDGLAEHVLGAVAKAIMEPTDRTPSAHDLRELCADFWYHTVWTAKHLRRGELWWAKGCCDGLLKELLRRMLEWEAVAKERDAWFRGRFLEEWADPDTVAGLRTAFAHYDEAETWVALERTMDLFAEATHRVTDLLDEPYPEAMERHARELVAEIQTRR